MSTSFSLDDTDSNPHPRMLEHALILRRAARLSPVGAITQAFWLGYLDCMCDATGENAEAINRWLDRHDTNLLDAIPPTEQWNYDTHALSSQSVHIRRP